MKAIHPLVALSGLAAAASAQVITTPGITASLDLSWQEDPAYPHNATACSSRGSGRSC